MERSPLPCKLSSSGFSITNIYVMDPSGEHLTETNGTGGWMHTNVFGDGKLLATYGGADTYFAQSDWLGTKRAETSAGGCLSTWIRLPFGNPLQSTGNCPDATEHHFTGKEPGAESGSTTSRLGTIRLRWDGSCRRTGPTKIMPVPYASLSDPERLNLYAYVRKNLLSSTDPDGHCCESDFDSISDSRVKGVHARASK